MAEIVIVDFSANSEGVTVKLSGKTRLKGGNVIGDTFYVSWDKIGKAIFEGYTDETGVTELNKIREGKDNG